MLTMEEIHALDRKKMEKTKAARNRDFARRSSDTQMLDHLTKAARVAVDSYFGNSRDTDAAMKELRTFVVLAERRTK